jgi:hypothetical protein
MPDTASASEIKWRMYSRRGESRNEKKGTDLVFTEKQYVK